MDDFEYMAQTYKRSIPKIKIGRLKPLSKFKRIGVKL